MLWFFTILDMFVLLTTVSLQYSLFFSPYMIVVSVVYLIVKALVFVDWMGYVDIIVAIYILFMAYFHIQTFIFYFIVVWFLYKLFFTIVRF
jgi:hypothetical protein